MWAAIRGAYDVGSRAIDAGVGRVIKVGRPRVRRRGVVRVCDVGGCARLKHGGWLMRHGGEGHAMWGGGRACVRWKGEQR